MISNERLNRILSFDEQKGTVVVQSGVVLHDLLLFLIPKSWILSTVPGTAYVTVGGMLASNVHGKNQYRVGSVSDHVNRVVLRKPDGEKTVCSPFENQELFNATIAGYGTTGFIEEVELAVQKLKTPYVNTSCVKTTSIKEQVEIMESKRGSCDFTIGWMDHSSLDGEKIHGIVEYANYCDEPFKAAQDQKIKFTSVPVPFRPPVSMVNSLTTRIFNKLCYAKPYPRNSPVHFYEFNFKLDKIRNWNRLYGPAGLIQYQLLIPKGDQMVHHVKHVLSYLKSKNVLSSLVVLKLHKNDRYGYLSFSRDGMSIVMDFPCRERALFRDKKIDEPAHERVPVLGAWIACL